MVAPEQPSQDTYSKGFDVVRMISNEFGSSPLVVRQQVSHPDTVIEIDGNRHNGDRFFIPIDKAQGKIIDVLGPGKQWRLRFPIISE